MGEARGLSLLTKAVFKDNLVHDVPAENASPPEKFFATAGELFEDHDTSTTFALHLSFLLMVSCDFSFFSLAPLWSRETI